MSVGKPAAETNPKNHVVLPFVRREWKRLRFTVNNVYEHSRVLTSSQRPQPMFQSSSIAVAYIHAVHSSSEKKHTVRLLM
jgi:hypothetical protein